MASIPDPPVPGADIAGAGEGGDYEVGSPIRDGWGGVVRDGRYRPSGRRVTVQDVRPDLVATPGLVDRLGRVGRDSAAVRDPHLLAVYDLVAEGSAYRLIAEWCDGTTVAASVRRGALPPARTLAALTDVLAGLEALHARGLFHGQVGPETVVLGADGRARLAELAICAAAAPAGFGPHTDVRDTARLGLHLLRNAGSRLDPVRRPLDPTATTAGVDAARLGAELSAAAAAALGPGWREQTKGPSRRRRAPAGHGRRYLVVALLVALVAAAVTAGVVLLGGRGGGGASPSIPLTVAGDASLAVSPATGGCNTTFAFVGTGSLSGTGTLVYRWEQSDGQVTANTSLPITSREGAFQLHQAWRLQGSQTVDGTMTLHILAPVDRSIKKSFHYSCK